MEILKIDNLKFSYANQERIALNNIKLSVEEGEFLLICGQSGCGKSTLLRHLKPELNPHGNKSGEIYYYQKNISEYDERQTSCEIGYVLQNPDAQIVTDKVWHELAFGLENMGVDTQIIRRRVAEMASFFGIQGWFRKNVSELSGGQKQLLNLASIMVMQPKILILDEPTSQLDPIAAKEFLDTIVRINRELGTTIILTEHNLEEIFALADKVLVMENGKVLYHDTPRNVADLFANEKKNHNMIKALPTPVRIYNSLKMDMFYEELCPLTIREGKKLIANNIFNPDITELASLESKIDIQRSSQDLSNSKEVVIELKDVWFQYNRGMEPTLRNVSFEVFKGEIYSILGGNGTGKTTTLSVISKLNKPLRGKIFINGKDIKKYDNRSLYEENLVLLPQNPQSLFVFETLKEDLEELGILKKLSSEERARKVKDVAKEFNIYHLLNQHPYDLSGGELQRAALAKIMLLNPKIVLLDEPTKGLDPHSKEEMAEAILRLKKRGVTMIIVTHDIEFSAMYSDRCAMFFDGGIVSEGSPVEFFAGNNFYTTSANRMVREIFKNALTCKDVVELCRMNCKKEVALEIID